MENVRKKLEDHDIAEFEMELLDYYERLHKWETGSALRRGPKPPGPVITLYYETDGVFVVRGKYERRPTPFYMHLWQGAFDNG